MKKGISLHIGLNRLDKSHYRGKTTEDPWEGLLKACESDAKVMFELASKRGFEASLLLTTEATRAAVKEKIKEAAKVLNEEGGYFLLTYSGHGGQVDDESGDEEEETDSGDTVMDLGGMDETWCLFDAQILDDELYELWAAFSEKVRILIFSDSCHSGTISKAFDEDPDPEEIPGQAARIVPRANLQSTYLEHMDFYDALQSSGDRPEIQASILQFSACQDMELAVEDQKSNPPTGIFTKAVSLAFEQDIQTYDEFFSSLKEKVTSINPKQNPNRVMFGKRSADFKRSKPLDLSSW